MKITHGINVASECLRESPVCLPAFVHLLDVRMKTLQGFEAYGVGQQIKHTHTLTHTKHTHMLLIRDHLHGKTALKGKLTKQ